MELRLKPKEAGLCVPRLITWRCYHFSSPFSERPQECSGKMGQAAGHTSVLELSQDHEPLILSPRSPASPAHPGPTTGSGINLVLCSVQKLYGKQGLWFWVTTWVRPPASDGTLPWI